MVVVVAGYSCSSKGRRHLLACVSVFKPMVLAVFVGELFTREACMGYNDVAMRVLMWIAMLILWPLMYMYRLIEK